MNRHGEVVPGQLARDVLYRDPDAFADQVAAWIGPDPAALAAAAKWLGQVGLALAEAAAIARNVH